MSKCTDNSGNPLQVGDLVNFPCRIISIHDTSISIEPVITLAQPEPNQIAVAVVAPEQVRLATVDRTPRLVRAKSNHGLKVRVMESFDGSPKFRGEVMESNEADKDNPVGLISDTWRWEYFEPVPESVDYGQQLAARLAEKQRSAREADARQAKAIEQVMAPYRTVLEQVQARFPDQLKVEYYDDLIAFGPVGDGTARWQITLLANRGDLVTGRVGPVELRKAVNGNWNTVARAWAAEPAALADQVLDVLTGLVIP